MVAEGVETERQREYLRNVGCDIMQGYLFSKPLPEDLALKNSGECFSLRAGFQRIREFLSPTKQGNRGGRMLKKTGSSRRSAGVLRCTACHSSIVYFRLLNQSCYRQTGSLMASARENPLIAAKVTVADLLDKADFAADPSEDGGFKAEFSVADTLISKVWKFPSSPSQLRQISSTSNLARSPNFRLRPNSN